MGLFPTDLVKLVAQTSIRSSSARRVRARTKHDQVWADMIGEPCTPSNTLGNEGSSNLPYVQGLDALLNPRVLDNSINHTAQLYFHRWNKTSQYIAHYAMCSISPYGMAPLRPSHENTCLWVWNNNLRKLTPTNFKSRRALKCRSFFSPTFAGSGIAT